MIKDKLLLVSIMLEELKIIINGHTLYKAGLAHFTRNFARDSIISTILIQDSEMLKEELIFCAERQGKSKNPRSGEEPGKIFHEYPILYKGEQTTEYNACDTTALFLIGHEVYQKLTGNKNLAQKYKENLEMAVSYIKNHLMDGAFIEDPKFSGGKSYRLRVTYWKDSEFFGRKGGRPVFPVIYTLAHIQNMRALRSAAFLLNEKSLEKDALKMLEFFQNELFDQKLGNLYTAIDKKGPINPITSDQLHLLFYLSPTDIKPQRLEQIIDSSKELETEAGYRTMGKEYSLFMEEKYHSTTVWAFEQAIINIAAKKHKKWALAQNLNILSKKLERVEKISSRVLKHLDKDCEILSMDRDGKIVEKGGSCPQLWTIAARIYFERSEKQASAYFRACENASSASFTSPQSEFFV